MKKPPAMTQGPKSWEAGYNAGHSGKPTDPPSPGTDRLAYASGFVEGEADRKAGRARPFARKPQP